MMSQNFASRSKLLGQRMIGNYAVSFGGTGPSGTGAPGMF